MKTLRVSVSQESPTLPRRDVLRWSLISASLLVLGRTLTTGFAHAAADGVSLLNAAYLKAGKATPALKGLLDSITYVATAAELSKKLSADDKKSLPAMKLCKGKPMADFAKWTCASCMLYKEVKPGEGECALIPVAAHKVHVPAGASCKSYAPNQGKCS